MFLTDAVSDLRLSPSFIKIVIHRRLICRAHIEVGNQPSIYEYAIPILRPCLAILLKWDQEQDDSYFTIYQRVKDELKACKEPLDIHKDDIPQLDQIWSMSLDDRQNFVRECLEMPKELFQQWNDIHSDYIFWLMIIRYWYFKRQLPKVYLYAVIVCLAEFIFLRTDNELQLAKKQFDSLLSAFANGQNRQNINPTVRQQIFRLLERMCTQIKIDKSFDNSITHELNCLQTIYLFGSKVNNFFNKPFSSPIHPHYFIYGSLFHAFVYHYRANNNLDAAMRTLFQRNTILLNFIHNIYTCISFEVQNEH